MTTAARSNSDRLKAAKFALAKIVNARAELTGATNGARRSGQPDVANHLDLLDRELHSQQCALRDEVDRLTNAS